MTQSLDIIVIDDDPRQATLLVEAILRLGHNAVPCSEAGPALDHLKRLGAHLVITDLRMPRIDGLELLKKLKEIDPELAVLLVTGYATVQTAVEAMRLGALDYLEKPVDMSLLRGKLDIVAERVLLKRENKTLRDQLAGLHSTSGILGNDERFKAVLVQL
ncbi:MAG TPA: response regulator, partial [Candidatus Ozemobacteraceae bacterium]|nr:response regulator [Candidatus Ozemobacteraceae bacterium]